MTCRDCGNPPAPGRVRCEAHLERARLAMRAYLDRHGDRLNEQRRARYQTPEGYFRSKSSSLMRRYGVTLEDYEAMLKEQGGKCAICLQPETATSHGGRLKSLAVDHCHETGEVRGLLCNNCNRALGLLGDSLDILAMAFEYLTDRAVVNDGLLA